MGPLWCSVVVTAGSVGGSPGGSAQFRLAVTDKLQIPDLEVAHFEDNNLASTISLSQLESLPPSIRALSPKGSLRVSCSPSLCGCREGFNPWAVNIAFYRIFFLCH